MHRYKRQDGDMVTDLALLLRKSGDKILSGESKLSLTTQSLSQLNSAFRRYSEIGRDHAGETTEDKKLEQWRTNAQFLNDFIIRTVSLKLTQGQQTMQGPVFISRFRNLQVLEFKKVPIHMLQGLQKLRGQLKALIVSRCLQNLQDLIETCGGDMSAPLSWPELSTLFISYNALIRLDTSLRLLPSLEAFDASHNQLEKTEHFLECLTEVERVNLGYNMLDSVPSFSLSSKAKIRTLVLRNNNLDSLEGIDDLVCLEELDVSENCLVQHSCLQVLVNLCKLCLLCLQGNPLSFHRSHRALTLQHISHVAGRNSFILDGKVISPTERLLTQKSKITTSRRPSQEAQSIIIGGQRARILDAYRFEDSDTIATNLKVGSPGGKRKITRRRSKAKIRNSADERSLDQSSTDYESSMEISRDSSPVRVVEGHTPAPSKEQVKVLRDHYGVNWLQAISVNKMAAMPSSLPTEKEMRGRRDKGNETEDDIYLNDSTTGLTDETNDNNNSDVLLGGEGGCGVKNGLVVIDSNEEEDDIEVIASDGEGTHSETLIQRELSGDFYSNGESTLQHSISREDSSHGVEWKRTDNEQQEFYGPESEPYIVVLPDEDHTELIVSVNQRYIIEKDLNGRLKEMLDLKCLEAITVSHNALPQEEEVEELKIQPTLKMKFDYMRKDRRKRNYIMEDDESAESFQLLLQPFIQAKDLDRKLQDILQCLKCSAQFFKSESETAAISLLQRCSGTGSTDENSEKYKCPKCGSQLVVQLTSEDKTASQKSTPVGSYTSVSSLQAYMSSSSSMKSKSAGSTAASKGSPVKGYSSSPQRSGVTLFSSTSNRISPVRSQGDGDLLNKQDDFGKDVITGPPVARSTPLKDDKSSVSLKPESFQKTESMVLMSRSDGCARSGMENSPSKSNGSSHYNKTDNYVTTPVENKAFHRDQPWSEESKSLADHPSIKRASVDSDITILTNTSEGSVAVISESSVETLLDPERPISIVMEDEENVFNSKMPLPLSSNATVKSAYSSEDNVQKKHLNLNGITEEGETTPLGSPLSTSICSSMVSSVYENSIVTTSEENLQRVDGDDFTNVQNTINSKPARANVDNNNGEMVSIYDSTNHNDSIYDRSTDNEFENNGNSQNIGKLDFVDNITNEFQSAMSIKPDTSKENEQSGVPREVTLETSMETSVEGERHAFDVFSESVEEVDYTKIDHRLSLYLMMNVLDTEDECQCAMQCDMCQYMDGKEFQGILILTSSKVVILRVLSNDDSEAAEKCLNCIENQPITELQYVDIGLGYQSLRFEFDTECSSYTFIVRDEKRCKKFITLVTSIIQGTAFNEHSRLQGISKFNAMTLDNLRLAVTSPDDLEEGEILDEDLTDGQEFSLVRYLSCRLVMDIDILQIPVGLAVSSTELCLLDENHQWPLPRLQAPLSEEIKGHQFTLRERQKINNIATVETCEEDHSKLRFTFFCDESPEEACWQLSFETVSCVQSLIDAIREPWETEFGVALDITPASFTDE